MGAGLWVAAGDSGVGWWTPETVVSHERGETSDEALCARVAARDEGAFDQLVERYQARAYRLAWSLLRDPEGFRIAVDSLSNPYKGRGISLVVGIESRGFILGAAVADRLGAGFVPVRKIGKLPSKTIKVTYDL